MLLTRDLLLDRLNHHLERSDRIDIAVAWAGECDALSRLVAFANSRGSLRAIVGIWGNATHPKALHELRSCGQLRIAANVGGLFHPKFYLFHQQQKRVGWVGSANLTRPGFQQNDELVCELSDKNGKASRWFDQLWDFLPQDCSTTLEAYESKWQPPTQPPRTPKEHGHAVRDIYALAFELTDWRSFVAAIAQADQYWSEQWGREQPVTGEFNSWLNTITLGRAVVRRDNWNILTPEDRGLILGRDKGWGYGLLGSMGGAGTANNVFREANPRNRRIRMSIRAALQPVIDADDTHFSEAACEFIAAISEFTGFSGGIATRLLALARPDRAISVNNGSASRIAQMTGLPRSSLSRAPHGRGRSYRDLLRWAEKKDWYSNPQPQDAYESLLANTRAGLFDALVYEPTD